MTRCLFSMALHSAWLHVWRFEPKPTWLCRWKRTKGREQSVWWARIRSAKGLSVVLEFQLRRNRPQIGAEGCSIIVTLSTTIGEGERQVVSSGSCAIWTVDSTFMAGRCCTSNNFVKKATWSIQELDTMPSRAKLRKKTKRALILWRDRRMCIVGCEADYLCHKLLRFIDSRDSIIVSHWLRDPSHSQLPIETWKANHRWHTNENK